MENKEIVASDLDGTYAEHPEIRGEVDFIITANNWEKFDNYDIYIPVYWNPGEHTLPDIVNHKANVINKTGATKFYEDQPIQVKLLTALCPKCKIIQVT